MVTDAVRPGNLFAAFHWSAATASDARVGALVRGVPDPVSGQPELKATPAGIAPVPYRNRGFLLTRGAHTLPEGWWWARATIAGGSGLQFATQESSRAVALMMRGLFQGCELAEYADHARGRYRCAVYEDGRLVACLALGPAEARPGWDEAKALFAEPAPEARRAARPPVGPGRDRLGRAHRLRLPRRRPRRHHGSDRGGGRHRRGGGRGLQGRHELRLVHPRDPQAAARGACAQRRVGSVSAQSTPISRVP